MPKFRVTVGFNITRYYTVDIEADDEDSIDLDAAIRLAGQVAEPDFEDGEGASVEEIEEIGADGLTDDERRSGVVSRPS